MTSYALIKLLHLTCAALSISGFTLRGILLIRGSALAQSRIAKTLPHIIDTLLLGSAAYLAWTSRQFPFVDAWLSAKLIALLLYIFLGMVALHWARKKSQQIAALLAALVVFAYIAAVALSRSPGLT